MPRSDATTVDEYLRSLPDTVRTGISRVRDVIGASIASLSADDGISQHERLRTASRTS